MGFPFQNLSMDAVSGLHSEQFCVGQGFLSLPSSHGIGPRMRQLTAIGRRVKDPPHILTTVLLRQPTCIPTSVDMESDAMDQDRSHPILAKSPAVTGLRFRAARLALLKDPLPESRDTSGYTETRVPRASGVILRWTLRLSLCEVTLHRQGQGIPPLSRDMGGEGRNPATRVWSVRAECQCMVPV